ncbi:ATP-binding protein [Caulobacter sp. UC70_42]|uniref:ATP-binding protein n=1 Tax=Caulobacter sp. UC70_42 TaxID=3374551 RepID=UPI0037565730
MMFQKAERRKAKLRLGLTGPSGSGKTWGALLIAKGIGGKIAVIDTERGSASLYTNLVDFDVLELSPPYTPERFLEAIRAAEAAGYETVIIDSITHEWNGVGGCLELVDQLAAARYKGNSWSAWSDVTPRHRAFLDAILRSSLHVIVTMRSKTETAQTEENGRKKVVKLGMKAEQRDGFEYEMTTVLDITHEGHFALASKDRTGLFGGDPKPISERTGAMLRDWLESGAEPLPSAADIAIDLLRANKDNLSETWVKNARSWQDVMGDEDFKRVVAEKDALKAKSAPADQSQEVA